MWRGIEALRARPADDPIWAQYARGESRWLSSAKLKLVDGCNLRCFMCEFWHLKRAGELSTGEVCTVLDDLRRLGCQKVHFTGGEIFLRRDAIALFEHAAALAMRVNLTTNGTRIDKPRLKAMLKVPVRSITLSVDSPVPRLHDALRGRPGAFKRTVRCLDEILARRGPKTRVRLNTVVSPHNLASLVELPVLLRARPVDGLLLIPMDARNGAAPDWTAAQLADYTAHVAPVLEREIAVEGFDPWIFGRTAADFAACIASGYARGYYTRRPCHVPWLHTLVNAVGDVFPCCMSHRRLPALGNVREASLVDIFTGPAYVEFRQAMLKARPAVCHGCDDFLAENRAFEAMRGGLVQVTA